MLKRQVLSFILNVAKFSVNLISEVANNSYKSVHVLFVHMQTQ